MVPVAVSVPNEIDINIKMTLDNWAFGNIEGSPRGDN